MTPVITISINNIEEDSLDMNLIILAGTNIEFSHETAGSGSSKAPVALGEQN